MAAPAVTVDLLAVSLGVTNGRALIVPGGSATGYIDPAYEMILDETNVYSPMGQMVHGLMMDKREVPVGLLAGLRSGFIAGVEAMNWAIHGNESGAISAALANPDFSFTRRYGLQLCRAVTPQMVNEYLDLPVNAHLNEVFTPQELTPWYYPALRSDETRGIPGTRAVDPQVAAILADPTGKWKQAFLTGRDVAMTFAFIVALHKHKQEGHHWISKLNSNPVRPLLIKAIQATKMDIDVRTVNSVLHDAFHPFVDLSRIVHMCMMNSQTKQMFNSACYIRYPFITPGTAVFSSAHALYEELLQWVEQSASGKRGAVILLFTRVLAVYRAIMDDVDLYANFWGSQSNMLSNQRQAKVVAGKKLAAFGMGMAEALGIDNQADVTKAPSLRSAITAHPNLVAAGRALGNEIKVKDPLREAAFTESEIDTALTSLLGGWEVNGRVVRVLRVD